MADDAFAAAKAFLAAGSRLGCASTELGPPWVAPNVDNPLGTDAAPETVHPSWSTRVNLNVRLGAGGDISLSLSLDLINIDPRDRELAFDLLDRLKARQRVGER